jgi:hypothetical protein
MVTDSIAHESSPSFDGSVDCDDTPVFDGVAVDEESGVALAAG